jgi:1-acyl-sn-glycerol-3-phosphate acyltransferase
MSAPASEVVSACLFGAAALASTAAVVRWKRRLPYSWPQFPLYVLVLMLTRVLWRAQVRGRVSIPPGQGALIVCNHRGPVDPAFVGLAQNRIVHWMVAREYWANPLFGLLFRIAESIPVNRGGADKAAIQTAIRLAQQGELVGLFPEGRINTTDKLLLPARPGVAKIALAARVPVVPCYITGSPMAEPLWRVAFQPAKTRLVVGRPIDVSEFHGRENDRHVLEEVTRRLLIEIARMGGADDYTPELAGRFRPNRTPQADSRS